VNAIYRLWHFYRAKIINAPMRVTRETLVRTAAEVFGPAAATGDALAVGEEAITAPHFSRRMYQLIGKG
jgi:hypothetical protein